MEFQFSAPQPAAELSPQAKASVQLAAIAGKLAIEERTRVYNTTGRPENVAEHSFMLAVVAPSVAEEFFPEFDAGQIAYYAAIHDIVEAYCGDTPTDVISESELAAKADREARAFDQLKQEYASLPKFVTRIDEYEAQTIPEARFVRMVDKLMPLLAHINDNGAGLRRTGYTPEALRENAKDRAHSFLNEYPDQDWVINLRVELADYVATQLELK